MKTKLRIMDVVRTKFGTVCVVGEINSRGAASLVFPKDTTQKIAWYEPEELEVLGNVTDVAWE